VDTTTRSDEVGAVFREQRPGGVVVRQRMSNTVSSRRSTSRNSDTWESPRPLRRSDRLPRITTQGRKSHQGVRHLQQGQDGTT
jgi:hypothetical protein